MSQVENTKCCNTAFAVRRQGLGLLLLALAIACGDGSTPIVRGGSGGSGAGGGSAGSGGTSGFGASAGTGGTAGSGGTAGTGGTVGSGGSAGSGGAAGSGGMAGGGGTGGTGASGGSSGACATNALCHTCPASGLCDGNDDCPSGRVCFPSGCETHGGDPIKQCMRSWAGSCSSDAECPNQDDYDCLTVGAGGERCVRVATGCNPATETYDCAPGFSCEGGTCVDRRMPCDSYENCPKSHICLSTPVSQYCARVSRTCHVDEDCSWLGNNFGTFCADVDGDLRKECIGQRDATETACVSSDCGGGSVCETGAVGSAATCGEYGLCRFNSDCGSGFECLDLWQDGRKECVPTGGTCDQVTDCDPQQVCAAPRIGGAPSCQSGTAP
jgi:hypothetical protein